MNSRRVYRYVVPTDDKPHLVWLSTGCEPLAVDAVFREGRQHVEFWAENRDGSPTVGWSLQVFATGQQIPDTAHWWGTTRRDSIGGVWHLFDVGHPTEPGEVPDDE